MSIEVDFSTFCNQYYPYACRMAGKVMAKMVAKNGPMSPYIDQTLIKDTAVYEALEKAYETYDAEREGEGGIHSYLYILVRNCVCNELRTNAAAVGVKQRDPEISDYKQLKDLKDLLVDIEQEYKYVEKEELIKEMISCMKTLDGVDQVILSCFMTYPKSEYTDMALEQLGWEDSPRRRNVIQVKCNRAIAALRKKMDRALDISLDIQSLGNEITIFGNNIEMPEFHTEDTFKQYKLRRISQKLHSTHTRHQREAIKNITRKINYTELEKMLASVMPD